MSNKLIKYLFTIVILQMSIKAKTFTFAVVPQFEPKKLYSIWKPILNELERSSGYKFNLVGYPNTPEFEKDLHAGKFDFAYVNPLHAIKSMSSQGYIPLVNDTSRKLSGIIVVKKDSDITSVAKPDSKVIAFPSPNALGQPCL